MTPAEAAARRARSTPAPSRRPRPAPLRALPRPARRASLLRRRAMVLSSVALVVASLVTVVVAHAIVDQQQLRLSALRSQIAGAEAVHASEQLKVAELEAPAAVVKAAAAEHAGASAPALQVPSVPLGHPLTTVHVAPATTVPPQGQ